MTAVMGIDAAWTAGEASGVAPISSTASGWRCVAVSPSYSAFMGLAAGVAVNWGSSVISELKAIHGALFEVFGPSGVPLPRSTDVRTLRDLKKSEDSLDALVCAWVGVRYLEGAAFSLGDETAAIWCPLAVISAPRRIKA